jgi:hypothetical protein
MNFFTIDNDTNEITLHPDMDQAQAAQHARGFASEEDWLALESDWPIARSVDTWNKLPGVRSVKKITDRPTGVRRIWYRIQQLAVDSVPESVSA